MTYFISLIQKGISLNKNVEEQSDPRWLMGITSIMSMLVRILNWALKTSQTDYPVQNR